jgi:hypothetical protein
MTALASKVTSDLGDVVRTRTTTGASMSAVAGQTFRMTPAVLAIAGLVGADPSARTTARKKRTTARSKRVARTDPHDSENSYY